MSHGPTARIFYGYDLGNWTVYHREGATYDERYEDLTPPWLSGEDEERVDWDEHLKAKLDLVETPIPAEFSGKRYDSERYMHWLKETDDGRAHMQRYTEISALVDSYPVELAAYGYTQGEECWSVQVKASVQSLYYYESKPLVLPLEAASEWDAQLTAFVELMELKLPRGAAPTWHFNCSYDG